MFLEALGYLRPDVDGFIYIHYTASPYSARLVSAPFASSRLTKSGCVPFAVCNAWQRSRTKNLQRVGEISGPILPVCKSKFTKFSDDIGDNSYIPTPLPDCSCHVSFRRYLSFNLEVVGKPKKCKKVLAFNFCVGRPRLSRIYCPPFDKVWLSFVC